MATFKERNREIQELVRELGLLRAHNLRFKEGDPQERLLLFAEAALVFLVLERFVRAILGDAKDSETLFNLLERAVSRNLLTLPWKNQQDGIRAICDARNALLHGNYEQAARNAGCESTAVYFKTVYAREIERWSTVVNQLFTQIDPATGQPYKSDR
jgi:hypothetical protein